MINDSFSLSLRRYFELTYINYNIKTDTTFTIIKSLSQNNKL